MSYRAIRLACGWSMTRTAAVAGVGPSSVRIFEIDPSELKDPGKRRALRAVYFALRTCAGDGR